MTRESASDWKIAFRDAIRAKIRRDLAAEEAAANALREEVLPKVRAAIQSARKAAACDEVWLFGSFAWGSPAGHSDVDLLVSGCASPFALAGDIWLACGRPAHVIQLEAAPESLRERVLAEGLRL